MLKPMDIHNKEFKKSVRGYDAEEVDQFLDEIIIDFEKMQRELELLRNQLNNYSENMNSYRDKETALNNALVSAQHFADQMRREAEDKASRIIFEAEEQAKEIIGNIEKKHRLLQADYAALSNRYHETKETLRDYFEHQIQMLDKNEPVFIKHEPIVAEVTVEEPVKEDAPIVEEVEERQEDTVFQTPFRSERKNGTNITATYFARSVNKTTAPAHTVGLLSSLENAVDNDETRINSTLKEDLETHLQDSETTEERL